MELIQIERIRFSDKEKTILNNAFNIINQVNEETINDTLDVLTREILDGLVSLEEFYE